MASKNVETLRAAHESWNRRDFEGTVRNMAESILYTDHARDVTLNSPDEFREWVEAWAKAASDGRIVNDRYMDAGDTVISEFTVEGTNDGPYGELASTGRRMSLPMCEIWRFNEQGQVVSAAMYYDQFTLLTQLGHAQPVGAAT
jgi:steroid delta-isomerase-like uncharacterized protein